MKASETKRKTLVLNFRGHLTSHSITHPVGIKIDVVIISPSWQTQTYNRVESSRGVRKSKEEGWWSWYCTVFDSQPVHRSSDRSVAFGRIVTKELRVEVCSTAGISFGIIRLRCAEDDCLGLRLMLIITANSFLLFARRELGAGVLGV